MLKAVVGYAFVFFSILLLNTHAHSEEINEATIAWEEGLKPPFLMLDANNKPVGIAVDILSEILSRNNISPVHIILPWSRCLSEIKNKNVDLVPNSSYTEERSQFAYYSSPIYETHRVLFYNTSKYQKAPKILNLEDFKPYRIGGILGFNYDDFDGKVDIDTGALCREALISKLKSGRIDIAIEQMEVMLRLARERKINLEGIDYITDPLKPVQKFYVLCILNDKGKRLKEIIDSGIAQLQADGTIDRIQNTYY